MMTVQLYLFSGKIVSNITTIHRRTN